jgi:hypothetical protein
MRKKLGAKPELEVAHPELEPEIDNIREVAAKKPDTSDAPTLQAWAEKYLKCPNDGEALKPQGKYMNLPYYRCPKCGWATVRH